MDAATMRQKFRDRTHNLAGGLQDGQVDVYLNQVFRYTIPDKVDGMVSDGDWSIATVAAQQTYQMAINIHTPRYPAYVDGREVKTYTHQEQFWWSYEKASTTTGKPTAILFHGGGATSTVQHSITCWPIPDDVYTITGQARVYPTQGVADIGDLNDTHALAVVAGAAKDFAYDESEDVIVTREAGRFQELLIDLARRSRGPARRHRWRPTF